jgi:hypothetical protein
MTEVSFEKGRPFKTCINHRCVTKKEILEKIKARKEKKEKEAKEKALQTEGGQVQADTQPKEKEGVPKGPFEKAREKGKVLPEAIPSEASTDSAVEGVEGSEAPSKEKAEAVASVQVEKDTSQ